MSGANLVCLCGSVFNTQTMMVQHATDHGHMLRCSCHRLFASHAHLQNHERDVHPQHTGSFEVLTLVNSASPASNSSRTTTHACDICHSILADEHGLTMHRQARHPPCPTCQQSFHTAVQLAGHQQATSHCYCAEHSLAFASNEHLRRHLQASMHMTGFECTSCDRAFRSSHALSDHLDSDGHANVERAIQARVDAAARAPSSSAQRGLTTAAEEANLRCDECNRNFRQIDALFQHKKSVKHNPLSDLRCPMSGECTQIFTSPSALLFHLEGGKCKSGMNRAIVNKLVHQHDTERQITTLTNVPSVLATAAIVESLNSPVDLTSRMNAMSIREGSSSVGRLVDISEDGSTTSDNDDGVPVLTPTTSVYTRSSNNSLAGDGVALSDGLGGSEWSYINAHRTDTAAAPAAYGSSSSSTSTVLGTTAEQQTLSCPVPDCEKVFQRQHSLLEHLKSPAHAAKLYRCPTGLALPAGRHSTKSFKTMSGILQHLEAGACVGGREALDQIFAMLETKITSVTGANVRLLREGGS